MTHYFKKFKRPQLKSHPHGEHDGGISQLCGGGTKLSGLSSCLLYCDCGVGRYC